MRSDCLEYPVVQIRPYGLLAFTRRDYNSSHREKKDRPQRDFKSYTGVLTPYSKKKLKRSIGLIVASAKEKEAPNFKTGKTFKFKLNFITFTLPASQQGIEDKTIKICLDNWIKRAKRKHNLNSYVWRAERQANGNLHFHMITDVWIHYEKIRNDWNSVLRETGLIDKFKSLHGHENPNSTDVHAIWKVKNLTQYFIKYMSKTHKEGDAPIKGKIWDCSKNLKTKLNCELDLIGEVRDTFDRLASKTEIESLHDPLFSILFIRPEQFDQYLTKQMRTSWEDYLSTIRKDFS